MKEGAKVTAIMNTYTFGASGGDIRFIEIFRRMTNVDITVVTPEQGVAFFQSRGLVARSIRTAPDDTKTSSLMTFPLRMLRASRILRKQGDLGIIYACADFPPDVIPAVLSRRKAARYVQVVHHLIPMPHERPGGMINNTISFLMQRLSLHLIKMSADVVIVVSPLMKRNLIKMGFDESKIFMNPNGVESAYFDSVAPGPIKYDAAFLGRLHVSKGIYDAVHIWKEVCRAHPNAKLAMIGAGQPKVVQALLAEIRRERMEDNIDVLGYLDKDDAFQAIKSSKMFIFPSHEEGFGIAILEAMACGVPVVAWDLPVYKEIFTEGMITAPIDDIGSFSKSVSALMDDEEMRRRMGEEARKLSVNYDWNKVSSTEQELITST